MGWGDSINKVVILVLCWSAGIVAMVMLLRAFCKQIRCNPGLQYETEPPLEILTKRYANGEIDKAEFLEKEKEIRDRKK